MAAATTQQCLIAIVLRGISLSCPWDLVNWSGLWATLENAESNTQKSIVKNLYVIDTE